MLATAPVFPDSNKKNLSQNEIKNTAPYALLASDKGGARLSLQTLSLSRPTGLSRRLQPSKTSSSSLAQERRMIACRRAVASRPSAGRPTPAWPFCGRPSTCRPQPWSCASRVLPGPGRRRLGACLPAFLPTSPETSKFLDKVSTCWTLIRTLLTPRPVLHPPCLLSPARHLSSPLAPSSPSSSYYTPKR